MCGINQNPAMNLFNNAMGAKPAPFGGNANPLNAMGGMLMGGMTQNPIAAIGGATEGLQAIIQIVATLAQALTGGQTQQQAPTPFGQPQNGGALGMPFGQPQNGGAMGPFGQPQMGGNFAPNPAPIFGPNPAPIGPGMPNPLAPQQPMDVMTLLVTLLTQLVQTMQGGNTAPDMGQPGNQGPMGGVNNKNNNGGVNQNVIVNGNNNGVIKQEVNGQQGGNAVHPFFLNDQDRKVQEIVNGKDGQWLVNHGQYKKEGDNFNITKGDLQGYVAQKAGDGRFDIINPNGQKVADYNAKGGANKVASPIAFDMNKDGKIGTTGETTAKDRLAGTELGATRQFDIDNDGTQDTVEWMTGDGDALLTDENGKLFGDEGGKYANGYEKLALRDANKDGQLTGAELNGLQLWTDNGDAVQSADEMVSAADAGISRISVDMNLEANARGENLMRADATINGQNVMSEDVWFGQA